MMNTDFESMGKTGMAAMKKDLSIALESAKEFSPRPLDAPLTAANSVCRG